MQKSSSTEFLYGLNPAFEAIRAGKRRLFQAYINDISATSKRLDKLITLLKNKNIPIESTDKGRLTQLAGSHEHQNVVIKAQRFPYKSHDELLESKRILLLDNVEDPHNVGAILRSADIFGFHSILLPVKGVPEIYPSVVKVSAGASEFLSIARDCSANTYVKKAQEKGFHIIALDMKGKSTIDAFKAPEDKPLLLVIGGEDKGVRQFILNEADDILSIPQAGRINSLNASVAAAISMFALRG